MKQIRKRFSPSMLTAAIILASAAAAQGQVDGLVVESWGVPLQGAIAQAWTTYPTGTILDSATTNADGECSLPDIGVSQFDLRVKKEGYYPTVIRGVPHPISNVLVALVPLESVPVSTFHQDFWGEATTFLGSPIQPGDVIEAVDPDGILAGSTQLVPAEGLYLIHVLGDAPGGGDEGALPGDDITFFINGLDAGPSGTWVVSGESVEHDLVGAVDVPGVTAVGPPDVGVIPGNSVLVSYSVTNSGTVSSSFDINLAVDPPWTIILSKQSSLGPLAPGETVTVDVLVEVPLDASGQTGTLTLQAIADTYGSANCGAITTIDVTPTSVWDNGGSGGLVPDQFTLAQNFPNPFNPETQIAFYLRAPGHVRLEIFNILGQGVRVLLDEFRPAGANIVQWDGRDRRGVDAPSGIYFYRLTQGAMTQTRQMALLR